MSNAKISAGDAAIALAVAGTANNDRFIKALYSIRGTLLLKASGLAGYPYPLELTRSAVVGTLKALPGDDACPLRLEQGTHAAEWFLCDGTAPAAKPKRERKPKREAAPVGTDTDGEPGTAPE